MHCSRQSQREMNAGAADGSDEAEQETTEQQSADTKKKEGEDGGAEAVIYNCPSPVEQKS